MPSVVLSLPAFKILCLSLYCVCSTTPVFTHSSEMLKNLPKTMRAVGLYKYLPISDPQSLIDIDVEVPTVRKNDVLIEVKAISVNPVDTKLRAPKPNIETKPRILGFDGAGIVVSKGELTRYFQIGDEVYFTADPRFSGTNAQYVAIDENLVAVKPKNLTYEQAAAMPLTTITAYESLLDRLNLSEKDQGKSLLIINSAGGVGCIASQIAKNLGMQVIGTASRPESEAWSKKFGADFIINHKQDLIPQLEKIGFKNVDYILVNYDVAPYWDTVNKAIKPQGKICLLVDTTQPVDIRPLKEKSVTLASEMMFTRIKYDTEDKDRLHYFLDEATKLFESGKLKNTLGKIITPINAANLREAHKMMENQTMIGKLVLSGF